MESRTASGLVVESRAAFPRDSFDVNPNDTVPPESDPGTVGPPDAQPGDPNGFEVVEGDAAPTLPPSIIRPSAWSGWPAEWATPNWGGRHLGVLTDVAWACLDLNSRTLATMPPYLVDAAASLDADWLINPNPLLYRSWWGFARELFWEWQAFGEVFIVADAYYHTGLPARFHVLPAWTVSVEWGAGELPRYTVGALDVTADVLHVKYQGGVDDLRGHGPLEVGAARLVAAAALLRYASNLVASGGVPHSVLKHPGRLSAEQAAELVWQWVDARTSAMGLTGVLSGGIELQTVAIDPAKMAMVDLSQLNDVAICRLLGVPAYMMNLPSGDSMTYSNVESIYIGHWRQTLSTFASAMMSALSQWALPRGTGVELNRDEYTKPPLLDRARYYEILHGIADDTGPVLSVTEIREMERFSVAAPSEHLTSGVLQ